MRKLIIICLTLCSASLFAESLRGENSYWQCQTRDGQHHSWSYSSNYKRKAINEAYAQCKQQSKQPTTCNTSHEGCSMIIKGQVFKNRWQCLALDKVGGSFRSDRFSTRNDAVSGAKALCRKMSSFPDSCYVRLITCKNKAL